MGGDREESGGDEDPTDGEESENMLRMYMESRRRRRKRERRLITCALVVTGKVWLQLRRRVQVFY